MEIRAPIQAGRWLIVAALVASLAIFVIGPATRPAGEQGALVEAMALADVPITEQRPLYEKIVYHYEKFLAAVKGSPDLLELISKSYEDFLEATKVKDKNQIDRTVLKKHKFRLLTMRNLIENQLDAMLISDDSMRLSVSSSTSSSAHDDDEDDDADSG